MLGNTALGNTALGTTAPHPRRADVLIGELSRATGVSPRLLRYYEEQGLLVARRDANGYRVYPETAVARVARIRELLDAGLNTAAIHALLPCVTETGFAHCDHSRAVIRDGLARLDDEIATLARRRSLLARHHDAAHDRH
ncbi:Zn(II)-responsive regulator of zntA [Nocardia otitidiscaviarum]|uniref:Zn(II)-responsive regulator of zntA n=1 Tax=Nocardia otitidiscaviarum TaxID=1823 RepID=A0A379JGS9_9NOCA|nr:Zn(II)-responsive regulator of zntA [Nocardia otitidiscaviarum]